MPAELTDYERVRVEGEHLSSRILVGQVIHADPSGQVTSRVDDQERAADLLRAEHVQVFTGYQRGRTTLMGAGPGLAIGIHLGGIGYYVRNNSLDKTTRFIRSLEAAVLDPALGAATGAVIGASVRYPRS